MTRKAIRVGRDLLQDESGQTMLEYVVIVVFVVIVIFIAWRKVKVVLQHSTQRASASIEQ